MKINKKKICVSINLIIFFLALNFIFINSIPNGILKLKNKAFNEVIVSGIFMEGFAFFTRNPREEQISVFHLNSLKKLHVLNAEASNYYGLSRRNRLINLRINKINQKIKPEIWINSKNTHNTINLNKIKTIDIKSENLELQGAFLLMKSEILPYSWFSNSRTKVVLNKKFLIVNFIYVK